MGGVRIFLVAAFLALPAPATATPLVSSANTPAAHSATTRTFLTAAARTSLTAATSASLAAATPAYEGRIGRGQVLRRAADWLRRDIPYSQDNGRAVWDVNRGRRYRPDCSGFVSMAWALDPARRGRALVTWELPSVARRITWAQLSSGDILLRLVPADRSREHVILFQRWTDRTKTRAWTIDQSGHTYGMRRRIVTVPAVSAAYRPYRYRHISGQG